MDYLQAKIKSNEIEYEQTGDCHKRLYEFKWVRDFIKKAIMTISYNSSFRSMKAYICEGLTKLDGIKVDNCSWYTTLDKK